MSTGAPPSQGRTNGAAFKSQWHGRGAELFLVLLGTPAQEAGLQEGDVVVGVSVRDAEDLFNILSGEVTGRDLELHVLRGDLELLLKIRPQAWSDEDEDEAQQSTIAVESTHDSFRVGKLLRRLRSLVSISS